MISAARRPRPAGNLTSRREQSGRDLLQSNKKSLRRMDIPSKGESACFRGTTLIRRRLAAGGLTGVRLDTDRLSL